VIVEMFFFSSPIEPTVKSTVLIGSTTVTFIVLTGSFSVDLSSKPALIVASPAALMLNSAVVAVLSVKKPA